MIFLRMLAVFPVLMLTSCTLGYDTAGDEERLNDLKAKFGARYDFEVSLDEGVLRARARDKHQPSREEAIEMFNLYFSDPKSTFRNSELYSLCVWAHGSCAICVRVDVKNKKPEVSDRC